VRNMAETFEELYIPLLKDVFRQHARQQLMQGANALISARSYAEQGKPDFTLAFLLESEAPEEEKREMLARSYEQHARNADQKAAQLDAQFHRSFPLIKLEAQKDRLAARAIRNGQRLDATDKATEPPVG